MNIQEFKATLDSRRKEVVNEHPEDSGRTTHCIITTVHNNKTHRFQVRSWKLKDDELIINAVNWTICAGPCSLTLNDDRINDWSIENET